jgi:D-methionine transport system permease protein
MLESISAFWAEYGDLLIQGSWESLIMVIVSTVLAYVIGIPLGVALIVTQPQGIRPHRVFYGVLGWIVNIGRSLPFAILLVALMPYTRILVGTAIGIKGAIPPLVISAAPFVARMVETSLSEVDAGVVEAARSMGASPLQTVWKVYLPEAKPSLILGGAISVVTILAYTAIAGMVGAGGLGSIAIQYGHNRGIVSLMWVTVVFLIIFVQVVQLIFNWLSKSIDKRLDAGSRHGFFDLFSRFTHTK